MTAIDCIEHITQAGERWDTLAWRYYGDPLAYGRIIAANQRWTSAPLAASGVVVLVPVLPLTESSQALQDEELPPWKR